MCVCRRTAALTDLTTVRVQQKMHFFTIIKLQFTLMHGQCLDVGVGGYLLGGGVNIAGSTNRQATLFFPDGTFETLTCNGTCY